MPTNREEYLKRHNLKGSQSLADLAKTSKVPLKILKQVHSRGEGAYSTNLQSVRLKGSYKKNVKAPASKKLSQAQWAMARVYSFLNKVEGKRKLNHDTDLAKKI
tara:strand:+ start:3048 stop:3359 length:312 start_codon:yes stop_codon:yes gene_type:complete